MVKPTLRTRFRNWRASRTWKRTISGKSISSSLNSAAGRLKAGTILKFGAIGTSLTAMGTMVWGALNNENPATDFLNDLIELVFGFRLDDGILNLIIIGGVIVAILVLGWYISKRSKGGL